MPLITWELKAGYTDRWDLYDLAAKLRERGWLVPAYPMTPDIEDMVVMRIVFRNGVSMDLMNLLLAALRSAVSFLDRLDAPLPREGPVRKSRITTRARRKSLTAHRGPYSTVATA